MEPFLRHTNLAYNRLKLFIDCTMAQMTTQFICKHQIPRIVPRFSCQQTHLRLLAFLFSEQCHHRGGCQNRSAAVVLCRGQAVSTAHLFRFLKLLVDVDRIVLKVDAIPRQSQHFPLPQSGEQGDLIHQPILRALDRLQKSCDLRLLHRLDLFSVCLWQITNIRRIGVEHSQLHGLSQRPVQHAVDVLHRLG